MAQAITLNDDALLGKSSPGDATSDPTASAASANSDARAALSSAERAHQLIELAGRSDDVRLGEREQVTYARLRIAFIAWCIIAIAWWQLRLPNSYWTLQDVAQSLYYLPCLFAAMSFGLRGGALASVACSAFTIYHVTTSMGGAFFGACLCRTLHIILLLVTSFGAGWLFDFSARARRRAEFSRDRLNEASLLLMKTSGRLSDSLGKLKQATLANARTEDQLRRAERLNAIGKLTAGLAHEIRNPLASIRGSAEILKDRTSKDTTLQEFVDIIEQETLRLDEVLTRFLKFAQSRRTDSDEVAIDSIVGEVIALIQRQADRSEVDLSVLIPSDLPKVKIAPIDLRQVVLNLILNSIQALATCESPRRISVEAFIGPGSGPGRDVWIILADNGPGVPEKTASSIFDPFFTTKDEGTGLGLAICDRIIRDAGGSISLVQREDCNPDDLSDRCRRMCGARFLIEIPVVEENDSR